MSATLLVLAAGMASRYGSLKQIDQFGPSGESIIDYSIYDAIKAGFSKVVFIIRKEFEKDFREIFEPRIKDKIQVEYVYQELAAFTDGYEIPTERNKPWGTAHAVLCAKERIHEPFAVINADDFYGKEAFEKAYNFLTTEASDTLWANICYQLSNTLSEHGYVSRGVCATDENGFISTITERIKIYRAENNIVYEEKEKRYSLAADTKVSMNFWCFSPFVFYFSQELFTHFLYENGKELKSEFFIPLVADEFIKQQKGKIKAITTCAQWFGVTYKEDKPIVQYCIDKLIAEQQYPSSLWQQQFAKAVL
ncbi:MAG: nucleotidyltransferase [Sphingobacteriales bacterium]|nr:nucleotidyltransferase [Sphingobacteriales bacterium]